MGLKAYKFQEYKNTQENLQFDVVYHLLYEYFKIKNIPAILVGNIPIDGQELDALLISKNSIVILEFKDYGGGNIRFSEHGPWIVERMNEPDIVMLNSKKVPNPFIQVYNYKRTLKDHFQINKEIKSIFLNSELTHIKSVVLFNQAPIQFDNNSLPPLIRKWFCISDNNNLCKSLDMFVSSIFLDEDKLNQIISHFNLNEKLYEHSIDQRIKNENNKQIITEENINVNADNETKSIDVVINNSNSEKEHEIIIEQVGSKEIVLKRSELIFVPKEEQAKISNSKFNSLIFHWKFTLWKIVKSKINLSISILLLLVGGLGLYCIFNECSNKPPVKKEAIISIAVLNKVDKEQFFMNFRHFTTDTNYIYKTHIFKANKQYIFNYTNQHFTLDSIYQVINSFDESTWNDYYLTLNKSKNILTLSNDSFLKIYYWIGCFELSKTEKNEMRNKYKKKKFSQSLTKENFFNYLFHNKIKIFWIINPKNCDDEINKGFQNELDTNKVEYKLY